MLKIQAIILPIITPDICKCANFAKINENKTLTGIEIICIIKTINTFPSVRRKVGNANDKNNSGAQKINTREYSHDKVI